MCGGYTTEKWLSCIVQSLCVCVCVVVGDHSGLQYLNMWNSHLEPSDSLGELLYQPNVLDVWRDLSSVCLQRLRERMSQERYYTSEQKRQLLFKVELKQIRNILIHKTHLFCPGP